MRTLSLDTQVEATREGAVSSTPTASALSPDVMQVGRIEMSPDTEVGRLEKGAVFSETRTEQKEQSSYALRFPRALQCGRSTRLPQPTRCLLIRKSKRLASALFRSTPTASALSPELGDIQRW